MPIQQLLLYYTGHRTYMPVILKFILCTILSIPNTEIHTECPDQKPETMTFLCILNARKNEN